MKKFVCSVCGYVHEGDSAPEKCPLCKQPAEKFNEQKGEREWAAEHIVGVAKGVATMTSSWTLEQTSKVNAQKLVCILQWLE